LTGSGAGVVKNARMALVSLLKQHPPQHIVIMMRVRVTMMESKKASEE
jgi:hypothetical protein